MTYQLPPAPTEEEKAARRAELAWPWTENPPRKPRVDRKQPPRPELSPDFFAPWPGQKR